LADLLSFREFDMSATCTWLNTCRFYQMHKLSEDKGFEMLSRHYCHGPYLEQCIRKIFKSVHGREADDRLGPDGKIWDFWAHLKVTSD